MWQAKCNNKHSWPSFCSWNSLPSSNGKCPRWLLPSNNSLSDTISPSSAGSECSLLLETSRWIKFDRWAMSAGRLTSLLLRRYNFVRWPKCHSDGLRFVIPPAMQWNAPCNINTRNYNVLPSQIYRYYTYCNNTKNILTQNTSCSKETLTFFCFTIVSINVNQLNLAHSILK